MVELTPELVADVILLLVGLVIIYFKGDEITRWIEAQSRAYREAEADDGGDGDAGAAGAKGERDGGRADRPTAAAKKQQ